MTQLRRLYSIGVFFLTLGILLGGEILYVTLTSNPPGLAIAVFAASFIIFGIQILVLDKLEQKGHNIFESLDSAAGKSDKTDLPDKDDVCVLIPTLNEAPTIVDVISGFQEEGFTNILVFDGDSDDGTAGLARDAGARVEIGDGNGKGAAVQAALDIIETEYFVMVDGDGTYDPEQADEMIRPLNRGVRQVIGNRFADMKPGAMTRLNQFGNRVINRFFLAIYREPFTDILSGYRAFHTETLRDLQLTETGFGIETDISTACAKEGVLTDIVDISYYPRPNESQTNLRPLRDGAVILSALYRFGKTYNPVVTLTITGGASIFLGLLGWIGVLLTPQQSHNFVLLTSSLCVLSGLQLLVFGRFANILTEIHQEISKNQGGDEEDVEPTALLLE